VALDRGASVTVADNWYATRREQLEPLERRGARVETADIRRAADVDRLFARTPAPERAYLLAAQASRPRSFREPAYTEETNLVGPRVVAERVGCPLVYASSLHVYGPAHGDVGPDHPYGPQDDLSHLSKVYAELCLDLYARRNGFRLSILRLAIVYGPSPVRHDAPDAVTVVDKFRRLAAAGEPLPVDDPDATVGVVHVEDAARVFLDAADATVANVAAETVTVGDVAALAEGREPAGTPSCRYASPFEYRHALASYFQNVQHKPSR
jgi:nucleoside-diphosphate-sugar epimerase